MKVFLSGKVDEHSGKWRDLLLDEKWVDGQPRPQWELVHDTDDLFDKPFANWPLLKGVIMRSHDYVGPYRQTIPDEGSNKNFGYFHGIDSRGSHGQMNMDDQQRVVAACMAAIDKCDMLFAFLNTMDCYGTISEIGYARAKGKFIAVVVRGETFGDDMWFPSLMADFIFNANREDLTEKEALERAFLEAVSSFVARPTRLSNALQSVLSHG